MSNYGLLFDRQEVGTSEQGRIIVECRIGFEAVPNMEADAFAADSNMSTDAAPPYPWSGTLAEVYQLEAVSCLLKAIEIYTDMGRFTVAAKHHMTIAEIYENEIADIEKAITHYEQAADFFPRPTKCLLNVAKYSAQLEQYEKAIGLYEQVASAALASPLMKYSAKEYFFCASLCHLCVDSLNAQIAIKKYEEQCPSFGDSRECKLVKKLMEKLEEQDIDGFTEVVKEYDSISRLDSWYTNILLRIKKTMQENPDL
ncbi:NAPA, partial [Cordylochernes scorpioides]